MELDKLASTTNTSNVRTKSSKSTLIAVQRASLSESQVLGAASVSSSCWPNRRRTSIARTNHFDHPNTEEQSIEAKSGTATYEKAIEEDFTPRG